jgi:hypothetical protein
MPDVFEADVYRALREHAGEGEVTLDNGTQLKVQLVPQDLHVGDSPDALLWVTVELRIFHEPIMIRVPVLIEAEKAGTAAAMEDLSKFAGRGNHPIEIPMIVVAASGFHSREERVDLAARVRVRQLPVGIIRG